VAAGASVVVLKVTLLRVKSPVVRRVNHRDLKELVGAGTVRRSSRSRL
jgi:hypothetical protein